MLTRRHHRGPDTAHPARRPDPRKSMSQRAQRLIEAARKVPLPEGTYAVGLGLLISGITAYGFLVSFCDNHAEFGPDYYGILRPLRL